MFQSEHHCVHFYAIHMYHIFIISLICPYKSNLKWLTSKSLPPIFYPLSSFSQR